MADRKVPGGNAAGQLALDGGPKAVAEFEASPEAKVGLEEFMALAELWGYGEDALGRVRQILTQEEVPSAHLNRYYNPNPSRVAALEAKAREIFGVRYALAVNSGTSALMAAYVACGIGPGHEVILPAYTFFATAAAVVAARAIPIIAEVDDSLTLDPEDVERRITPRTKAIVTSNMVGNATDMDRIMALGEKHDVTIIEDNAQACGGTYKGKLLGTFGAMGCFSISGYKITGAGEAGLVLTDDEYLYIRAQNQHDTAACWRPERYAKERRPGELFVGQNYRLSEMEGAVNLVQLSKTVPQARRYNANRKRVLEGLEEFETTKLRRSNDPDGDVGYTLALLAESPQAAQRLIEALQAEGVPAGGRGTKSFRDWHLAQYWEHFIERKTPTPEGCPFTCPYYEGPEPVYSPHMCPRTVDYLNRAVFVSVDQWWTASDCRMIARAINKVCGALG